MTRVLVRVAVTCLATGIICGLWLAMYAMVTSAPDRVAMAISAAFALISVGASLAVVLVAGLAWKDTRRGVVK